MQTPHPTQLPTPLEVPAPREVLLVVVRYNVPLDQSHTLLGLASAFRSYPHLLDAFDVLLLDNSPDPLPALDLSFPVDYRHSLRNEGVSGAYNRATPIAIERGLPWMLLLDQDTSITAPFLLEMLHSARQITPQPEVAAIVPTVRVGTLVVSPRQTRFNSNRIYDDRPGIAPGEPFAINSGTLMRVSALQAIGGFSSDFWLDYSDMYVFHQFFLRGYKVWRATAAGLIHEMSIMDYDNLMPTWRYRNFIEAEGAFNDLYKGWFENCVQSLRLVVRAFRQRRRYQNPEFSRITLQHLRHRLVVGRRRRLDLWQQTQRTRPG